MASTTSSGGNGNGSGVSMMKEYLKKQLKYWVENFRDDMLPRDFSAKSFSRSTITLHKIELKVHKVAATLQIPKPLLVTEAYCSEVAIKAPSWTAAEKFAQEPLSFRVVDLFIGVKNAFDCDEAYRKAADARAHAAIMEPDPLGSIASWCAFSTVISERLEPIVDNIYIKVFSKGVSRIRLELTNLHSRTTDAMWQDMRDLTTCVDCSPDGLLKTRFRFISFSCSIPLTQSESPSENNTTPPLQILHDHEVTMRMTLFGHRQSKSQSWEALSQVVDVNLHTLPLDYEIAQLLQIYQIFSTVSGWIREAAEQEQAASASGAGLLLHHHQIHRSEVTKSKADSGEENNEASFALQLTFRFTAEAKLRFTSERLGKHHVALVAQHAAVNLIVHHDNVRELQVTIHEVKVHFQDQVVLYLKPDRDVMQLKQLRESIFVKWHHQTLACNVEGDLVLVLNEAYHAHNEKEQSALIKCGTCAQQIRLESIETHVCDPIRSPAPSTASSTASHFSSRSVSDAQDSDRGSLGNGVPGVDHLRPPSESGKILDSTTMPKLRLVFALDELELSIDNHLFHNVQQLMRSSHIKKPTSELVERKFGVQIKELSVTTEAKEFVGDAIFVPVLPLAFQMLECTLQGCGCIRNNSSSESKEKKQEDDHANSRTSSQESNADTGSSSMSSSSVRLPRWPDRVFVELGHLKCTAKSARNQSSLESFFTAEAIALRASFSDGERICVNCHPQVSLHASVGSVRCQLDHPALQFLQTAFSKGSHNPLQSTYQDPGECLAHQEIQLSQDNEAQNDDHETPDGVSDEITLEDGDEAETSEHDMAIEDEEEGGVPDDLRPSQGEEEQLHEAEYGLDEALLAKLPDVIHVLVQIDEHRVRVPINPREKVGFLCREVVRRFNELFASHSGFISHVTLQDFKGGVFAANDIVGFVYTTEDEVFFALPHQLDAKIWSIAHIESTVQGSKPALPLPLAIALLANESERDLVCCVLSDGSFGSSANGGNDGDSNGKQVDEWLELALNVSFLDPSHILPVEVRWFGKCLEVTNVDAFVLCLQQLGLCTSRASSKYVGKILRDRLKVDSKNPIVRSAYSRSSEFAREAGGENREANATTTTVNGSEEDVGGRERDRVSVSYSSLKEIVQDDYGVYYGFWYLSSFELSIVIM